MSTETIVEAEMKPWYDAIEEKVVEAYKASGLKPGPYGWHVTYENRCCALGALQREACRARTISTFEAMAEEIGNGATSDEVRWFAFGFDHGIQNDTPLSADIDFPGYMAGFKSGRAVINAGL